MQHGNAQVCDVRLQEAVNALDIARVEQLLAEGASPSLLVNNTTALHLTVRKYSSPQDKEKALAILDKLLEKGDINQLAAYRTVMNLAGHNSFWEAVLKIATKKKSDEKDNGHYGSALVDAIRFCDDEKLLTCLIDALLEAGAKVNRYNREDGYNALHWAVDRRKPDALRRILAKFPLTYLEKSIETPARGKAVTPARQAFNLDAHECLAAIAQVAYVPVISGRAFAPDQLKDEKDIIFKIVCSLPVKEKWVAILNGIDENHALGQLNHAQTKLIPSLGDTDTVKLYKEEKKRITDARQAPVPSDSLRSTPQMFQSAPRLVPLHVKKPGEVSTSPAVGTPDWMISDYVSSLGKADPVSRHVPEVSTSLSYSPFFSAPPPSPPLAVPVPSKSKKARSHSHSVSPEEFLQSVFGKSVSSSPSKDNRRF